MLKISEIYPPLFEHGSSGFFRGFVRSVLMRSCFNVDVKRALGISGFYRSVQLPECWTMKLLNTRGVYGLAISEIEDYEDEAVCTLLLKYFPEPDEEVLDDFSVWEIMTASEPSYMGMVRDFAAYEGLAGLFGIGQIKLRADKRQNSLSVSLTADTVCEVYMRDGLYVNADGKELVPPMGLDRSVRSFDLALPFFKMLAGSIAYSLDETACSYEKSTEQGFSIIRNPDGTAAKNVSDKNAVVSETVFFGGGQTNQPPDDGFRLAFTRFWENRERKDVSSVMDTRPRLMIVSGFLGSGKTTFIRYFLEHETDRNRFAGIIQNESGQSGLDGFLVDYDYSLVEIDEGCMCCSLSGQLKKAVTELTKDRMPDTIILETSGVANPMNLLHEIEDVKEMVRFDSVTTLVDVLSAYEMIPANELVRQQIISADIVILNKCTDRKRTAETASLVAEINPNAMIVAVDGKNINFSMLYGTENESGLAEVSAHRGHNHHHEGIKTRKYLFEKPVSKQSIIDFIEKQPADTFRIKGVVDIEGEGSVIVQAVNGRWELSRPDREPPSERFLIVIGRNV